MLVYTFKQSRTPIYCSSHMLSFCMWRTYWPTWNKKYLAFVIIIQCANKSLQIFCFKQLKKSPHVSAKIRTVGKDLEPTQYKVPELSCFLTHGFNILIVFVFQHINGNIFRTLKILKSSGMSISRYEKLKQPLQRTVYMFTVSDPFTMTDILISNAVVPTKVTLLKLLLLPWEILQNRCEEQFLQWDEFCIWSSKWNSLTLSSGLAQATMTILRLHMRLNRRHKAK